MATALLPIKDLVAAKTRLSGLLTPSERRQLAQAMAEDVLSCLQAHPAIEQITLVSDDSSAPHLARGYGADCLDEQTLGCHGLNPVIAAALSRLEKPSDGRVMVLHGDLPALTQEDISAALDAMSTHGMVIGCDRAGTGTNMLLFAVERPPAFCFGVNSCTRHTAWAAESGILCKNLQTSGFGFDVDLPEDMLLLLEHAAAGMLGECTSRVLGGGLAARLAPALASLSSGEADSNALRTGDRA